MQNEQQFMKLRVDKQTPLTTAKFSVLRWKPSQFLEQSTKLPAGIQHLSSDLSKDYCCIATALPTSYSGGEI